MENSDIKKIEEQVKYHFNNEYFEKLILKYLVKKEEEIIFSIFDKEKDLDNLIGENVKKNKYNIVGASEIEIIMQKLKIENKEYKQLIQNISTNLLEKSILSLISKNLIISKKVHLTPGEKGTFDNDKIVQQITEKGRDYLRKITSNKFKRFCIENKDWISIPISVVAIVISALSIAIKFL